jgi:hypothetical protein
MKALIVSVAAVLTASFSAGAVLTVRPLARPPAPRVVGNAAGGFSVDLPIVGRVHGATTFITSLDVTNNTSEPTEVEFSYVPADGSAARGGLLTTLSGFDNLHVDDFLQGLAASGVVAPGQGDNGFGTLLLTFTNPSFTKGTEASAVARVYSFAPGGSGTFGLAYRAPALRTNGAHALTAMLRAGGGLVSNIGIENVGINDAGAPDDAPVTVRLTFYDPVTGAIAGAQRAFTLASGQVVQINDATKKDAIVFVDEIGGTAQIRGYAVAKDTTTNDGAFVFMQEQ